MLVVDSSAWIEFYKGGPGSKRFASALLDNPDIIVPTIVVLEVAKWADRELGADDALVVIGDVRNSTIIPLDFDLAVQAAEACRQHRLATADAIVYATAQSQKAELLTCDSHFKDLPGVQYFAKDGE